MSGKSVHISLSDSDAQREERREILYLLDKYGVSDAFYQALSMKCDSFQEQAKLKLLDRSSTKQ